jgi:hypothetical protein
VRNSNRLFLSHSFQQIDHFFYDRKEQEKLLLTFYHDDFSLVSLDFFLYSNSNS